MQRVQPPARSNGLKPRPKTKRRHITGAFSFIEVQIGLLQAVLPALFLGFVGVAVFQGDKIPRRDWLDLSFLHEFVTVLRLSDEIHRVQKMLKVFFFHLALFFRLPALKSPILAALYVERFLWNIDSNKAALIGAGRRTSPLPTILATSIFGLPMP